MKIKKAVLPVAGLGTRFLPATKVVPKELLPIVDKPVIQYLVEEVVASGIEDILFIISPDKELIRAHFSPHKTLEETLLKRGKEEMHEKITPIHQLARFHYAYQNDPKGDGHAVLQAEEFIAGEPFLVLFGDDIVKADVPAAKQLIDCFRGESIMAVEEIPKEETLSYGIIEAGEEKGRLYEVLGMVEKPAPEEAPSQLGIIGKYICTPEIFEALKNAKPGKDGEIRLIDGFIELKKNQKLWAYAIEGERFDTGKVRGLIAANQAFYSS